MAREGQREYPFMTVFRGINATCTLKLAKRHQLKNTLATRRFANGSQQSSPSQKRPALKKNADAKRAVDSFPTPLCIWPLHRVLQLSRKRRNGLPPSFEAGPL